MLSNTVFRPQPSGAAISGTRTRALDEDSTLIDLIDLEDFNVQLARLDDGEDEENEIQVYELTDLITEWMNGSYEHHLAALGYDATNSYAEFDTVILLERKDRSRMLLDGVAEEDLPAVGTDGEDERPVDNEYPTEYRRLREDGSSGGSFGGQLYTANFKGAALFTRNQTQMKVPQDVVQWVQGATLANKTGLLYLLQNSGATGLGSQVVDINTFAVSGSPYGSASSSSAASGQLEIIIIVAVAVAAVAFIFLVLAIFWAWRYDRRNREAYLVSNGSKRSQTRRSDPTGSNSTLEDDQINLHKIRTESSSLHGSPQHGRPMSEIGGESIVGGAGVYPESVISEDISTSLSQYYRSGMSNLGAGPNDRSAPSSAFDRRGSRNVIDPSNHFNDAASVSSMESYGYSLDGYAPSMIMMSAAAASSASHASLPYAPKDIDLSADTSADHSINISGYQMDESNYVDAIDSVMPDEEPDDEDIADVEAPNDTAADAEEEKKDDKA